MILVSRKACTATKVITYRDFILDRNITPRSTSQTAFCSQIDEDLVTRVIGALVFQREGEGKFGLLSRFEVVAAGDITQARLREFALEHTAPFLPRPQPICADPVLPIPPAICADPTASMQGPDGLEFKVNKKRNRTNVSKPTIVDAPIVGSSASVISAQITNLRRDCQKF